MTMVHLMKLQSFAKSEEILQQTFPRERRVKLSRKQSSKELEIFLFSVPLLFPKRSLMQGHEDEIYVLFYSLKKIMSEFSLKI